MSCSNLIDVLKYGCILALIGCQSTHQSKIKHNAELDATYKEIRNMSIYVVTPASGITNMQSEALKTIGVPVDTYENKKILSSADTDANRIKNLLSGFNSGKDIVWCMRGGYGAYRLVRLLQNINLNVYNKTFVGYSDITALNLYLHQRYGCRVIHGPIFRDILLDYYDAQSMQMLLNILNKKITQYTIEELVPLNKLALNRMRKRGKLTGGNITLVECSIGTSWEIQTEGKIVFLEDVNITGTGLYRSLYHLFEAGKFKSVQAIVFGDVYKLCDDKKSIDDNLAAFAKLVDVPVFITSKFGHGATNIPIVYGADGEIIGSNLSIKL